MKRARNLGRLTLDTSILFGCIGRQNLDQVRWARIFSWARRRVGTSFFGLEVSGTFGRVGCKWERRRVDASGASFSRPHAGMRHPRNHVANIFAESCVCVWILL